MHRGVHQVGGSCVELEFLGSTILLDLGLPLDCDFKDGLEDYLPQPLFGKIKFQGKRIGAVIFSHAHLDHYGLSGLLPRETPYK